MSSSLDYSLKNRQLPQKKVFLTGEMSSVTQATKTKRKRCIRSHSDLAETEPY